MRKKKELTKTFFYLFVGFYVLNDWKNVILLFMCLVSESIHEDINKNESKILMQTALICP